MRSLGLLSCLLFIASAHAGGLEDAVEGFSGAAEGLSVPAVPCPPGQMRAIRNGATACVPTAEFALCRKNGKGFPCDKSTLPRKTRSRFHDFLIQAVNEQNELNRAEGKLEIHPATLLSFLAAESSGNPLSERADGGKGLGQFTFADSALKYGLDYSAPKPGSREEAFGMTVPLRRDAQGRPIYSIWSVKGSILAMARKLSEKVNAEHYLKFKESSGREVRREASVIYKGSDVLSTRYMAGVYNRGNMVFNSIQEYYRQSGTLPEKLEYGLDYGAVWETPRVQGQTPAAGKFPILYRECINRCHVERIAGLCGTEPQGFFAEYSKDFKRRGTQWGVAS